MTAKKYVLLFWESENSYSVVPEKKILSGLGNDALEGKTVVVLWKKEELQATMISHGTKLEMKQLENDKIAEALELSFATRENSQDANPAEDENRIEPCDRELVAPKNLTESIATDVTDEELQDDDAINDSLTGDNTKDARIRNLELKLARLEKQNRELKKFKNTAPVDSNGKMRDIGSGIFVKTGLLNFLKLGFRDDPPKFFRKLLLEILELKTLASSSMYGRPSVHTRMIRPALDPRKLKSIKAYTIKTCNLQPRSYEMAEFERKIKNVCSDARKTLKRNMQKEQSAVDVAAEID